MSGQRTSATWWAQQHISDRDGLPARDPARAHQGGDGHEPHSEGERHQVGLAEPGNHWLPGWLPKLKPKNLSDQSGRRDLNPRPLDPQASSKAKLPAKILS